MKPVILLVLLVAVGSLDCYGQLRSNSPHKKKMAARIQKDIFKETAGEIKTARPNVRSATLACDKHVIVRALPSISRQFEEKGFDNKESTAAALDGWKIVRLDSPLQTNRCMRKESFQMLLDSLGKIVFSTTPDKASIQLEGRDLGETTAYAKWFEPKTYSVKYSKDGYDSVELECAALKGKSTDCRAELKKKN